MREIKFRVWDKVNGCWASIDSIALCDDGSVAYLVSADGEPPYLEEDVEIMQYAGLDDVNGKPIYEDDIVKSNYKYAQPKISQIIMEDGNSYIAGEDLATGNEMLVSDHVNEIEVIGNVHTNPELLRGGEMSNSETTECSHNGADWIVQESDFIKDDKMEAEK